MSNLVHPELRLAVASEDWLRAATLVSRNWTTLMFDTEAAPDMWDAIQRMPENALLAYPKTALMGEGIGRLPPLTTKLTLPTTKTAVSRALANGTARDAVELAIHRIIASAATGHLREARDVADESALLLRESSANRFGACTDLASYWYLQAGHARLLTGDFAGAHRDLSLGWDFRVYDVTGYAAVAIAPYLALFSAILRETDELARWDAIVDGLAEHGSSLMEWRAMERPRLVARLFDAAQRLELDAGRAISEALDGQLGTDELWPFTLMALTQHWVNVGSVGRATRQLAAAQHLPGYADPHGVHRSLVAIAEADVAYACGRGNEAERFLASVTAPSLQPLAALYSAHVHLLAGEYATTVRRTALFARSGGDTRIRGESRILGALAEYGLGDPAPLHHLMGDATARALAVRTLSLIPGELHARLSADPVVADILPALNPLIADTGGLDLLRLTEAEQRIVAVLGNDCSLAELAASLHISPNTLKTHLRSVYAKLGVASREEAARVINALGLA